MEAPAPSTTWQVLPVVNLAARLTFAQACVPALWPSDPLATQTFVVAFQPLRSCSLA